ncbi:class II glutamine amidotransferase [Hahella sp. SMD15-11]|uniref:Class II glutamine amidotransferase n=1 Tax=Thermohahella caldifontis TaxID=3142973 RepID=A0AB39UXR3_9GAMM
MCELMAMSANVPTDIQFSWEGLRRRGGEAGPHRDGWGMAFYEGKGIRVFRDPNPSSQSEMAEFVCRYPLKSKTVISHIRQANQGEICLANTHPFVRELFGHYWCFAHNGQVPAFRSFVVTPGDQALPVGTTDSEHLFCWMLNQIRHRFDHMPDVVELGQVIHELCTQISAKGVFNLLLSEGRALYVYCHTHLHQITRRAPFGRATLADSDIAIDFSEHTTPGDVVTVLATQPLTVDEAWEKLPSGQLRVLQDGEVTAVFEAPTGD